MPKVRKAELSFLYETRRLILFYVSTKYNRNITKSIQIAERSRFFFSNKTKGDHSKSKKARSVNLVCDVSSRPDLHFYQVSSKYSEGYSSLREHKKFYTDADADAKSKKGRVVILVCNTSSCPILHFYQVPSNNSIWYYCYRADTKSMHNHCQI